MQNLSIALGKQASNGDKTSMGVVMKKPAIADGKEGLSAGRIPVWLENSCRTGIIPSDNTGAAPA